MFNASVLDVYRHFFAARQDVYSHWTPDGWRPVRDEMTVDVIAAGLDKTGPAISGYMIAPGNRTHVAAVDFDLEDGMALALRLAAHMKGLGAPAYVEESRRGAHVWMLLWEVVPARQIRSALNHWLDEAGMPHDPDHPGRIHPKIELRPATDTINGDGLGHCLRMPLMPHPKTGKRFPMLTPEGNHMGNKLSDILLDMEMISISAVEDAAMRWVPVVTTIPSDFRSPKSLREDDGASASNILSTLWGAHNAAPGRVISCPAKQYHSHGDVHPGLKVAPDDKRVWCHKPGCILSNDGKGRGTWELTTMAPGHE